MTHPVRPGGAACRRRRCAALLVAGVLLPLPVLTGCGGGDDAEEAAPGAQDIAATARDRVRQGGTLRWAVDAVPGTLNAFQPRADAATRRVTEAVLPRLFTLDQRGRPQRNPDYLAAADVTDREPRQTVVYKINPKARWSGGRAVGPEDFAAQWNALRGKDNAYWSARNAGYDRIEKVEQGGSAREVKVTFAKPYADWKSLFTPLYPKSVMGDARAFNDGAREELKETAGPFAVQGRDEQAGTLTLARDPKWWGAPAKLDKVVLTAVPREKRAAALAAGTLDLAEVDPDDARKITAAGRPAPSVPSGSASGKAGSPGTGSSGAGSPHAGSPSAGAPGAASQAGRAEGAENDAERSPAPAPGGDDVPPRRASTAEQQALRGYTVRKALEPAYTQLALNGSTNPLNDERVRRAVARAIDRQKLADSVLKPLGLPNRPLGSHLLMAGQPGYADHSGALGGPDTGAARAMLADAGWRAPAGTAEPQQPDKKVDAGHDDKGGDVVRAGTVPTTPLSSAGVRAADLQRSTLLRQSAVFYKTAAADRRTTAEGNTATAAYADYRRYEMLAANALSAAEMIEVAPAPGGVRTPDGRDGPGRAADGKPVGADVLGLAGPADPAAGGPAAVKKDGRPLALRFVLPDGPGSERLRTVADRISAMLARIGVQTVVRKVPDKSYFEDHIAAGDFDLALYTWPGSAYPATDGRPIYAKPQPAADGSLTVEQNYTRVGTDHIDQLFDQAAAELDEDASRELVERADARIWAAAGSVPLYQRPEVVAVKKNLVNAGAFGFSTPRYQDIGFKKS
ncbi:MULTISPECIES: ABC transporter family substrate-binding protein [Streptomyces]|uniref:ABC transporter family substrate-binding protein n=2 Tax=Streptomyces rimosus subsp. rimosus TaxID=132474 RepID=L8EV73_STRR1|nr:MULTISPECIES: ABC transporter family substrate-binding protein [Streptomyces]KOG79036.1 ABC transporter substrate-binding protein [Kitasatospora aureofaciens]MYT47490.1 ABC transporter family substrate-binding protein [Streptomyces sp. SID5471]KEF04315.1 ABC transporter substrate-binding protein [Streptomyces rimosus]KEF17708.1 ABC transporter substrate-binding protein [Streptomyces rimosus]KOT40957.1 ABC transporter substrate-binding protein [Streptomyces rimosus subsp. rimosus]